MILQFVNGIPVHSSKFHIIIFYLLMKNVKHFIVIGFVFNDGITTGQHTSPAEMRGAAFFSQSESQSECQ